MDGPQQWVGPIVLFLLMVVVGFQLTPDDFRRVLATPRAVVGGTLGQLLLLPLMTWALSVASGAPPIVGAGAFLLAASPGAGMSNVMAAIAGAHVALSVSLTAVSSVLAVVTLPALTALGIEIFVGREMDVDVPVTHLVSQLVLFLLVPIGVGMVLRARRSEGAQRIIHWANRAAVVAIVLLTVLSVLVTDPAMVPGLTELGFALLLGALWTLAAMAIGWGLAGLLGLAPIDRFTFLIEFSARNIALAFIVAVAALGRLDLVLFAGGYALTGYPLVIALSIWHGRRTGALTGSSAS